MTATPLDFLRATLDAAQAEAEAARDAAGSADWEAFPDWGGVSACGPQGLMTLKGSQDSLEPQLAAYVAAHDPAAVLRRIAADRELIALHASDHECSVYDDNGEIDNYAYILESETCSTVQLIAEGWGWTGETG